MLQPHAGQTDAMSPMQYGLTTIENWADPPLRGYNSMPALHSVPEDCPIYGLAPAPPPVLEQVTDPAPALGSNSSGGPGFASQQPQATLGIRCYHNVYAAAVQSGLHVSTFPCKIADL